MKLLILRFLFVLLAAPLLLSSCDKDEYIEPTNTDLVVAHEWRGEAVIADGMDVSDMQQTKDMLLDIKSTRITLRRDGTYTAKYDQAGTAQTSSGTWTFKEDEKVIHFDLLGDLNVKELTATSMILEKEVEYLGNKVMAEVRFVKNS